MSPLLPQTGSTREEEQEQPVLHQAVRFTWKEPPPSKRPAPLDTEWAIDLRRKHVSISWRHAKLKKERKKKKS